MPNENILYERVHWHRRMVNSNRTNLKEFGLYFSIHVGWLHPGGPWETKKTRELVRYERGYHGSLMPTTPSLNVYSNATIN